MGGNQMATTLRLGVLTLSDSGARGDRVDTSGPAIVELLAPFSPEIIEKAIIPDEPDTIRRTLRAWVGSGRMNLIVTTGGTGLGPRDVTPEATRDVIDREIPGLAELMRAEGLKHTPMAAIGRGIAGLAGSTLILNVPGSETAARQNLQAVLPVLEHALDLIAGDTDRHPTSD
jgi:molybdenum cofactor synthesis domain-containing protein